MKGYLLGAPTRRPRLQDRSATPSVLTTMQVILLTLYPLDASGYIATAAR